MGYMNNVIKILSLVFLVFTASCEGWTPPPSEYTFRLVGKWNDDEIAAVNEAFEEWCVQSQGEYCAKLGSEKDSGSILEMSPKSGYETGYLGMWFGDKIALYDVRDSGKYWIENVYLTMLHELGHHFRGRGHLPAGNIMAPCGWTAKHLTEADIYDEYSSEIKTCDDQFEAVKGLKPDVI